jgi:hypothetical protein
VVNPCAPILYPKYSLQVCFAEFAPVTSHTGRCWIIGFDGLIPPKETLKGESWVAENGTQGTLK